MNPLIIMKNRVPLVPEAPKISSSLRKNKRSRSYRKTLKAKLRLVGGYHKTRNFLQSNLRNKKVVVLTQVSISLQILCSLLALQMKRP